MDWNSCLVGGSVVAAVVFLNELRQLWQWPEIAEIEENCQRSIAPIRGVDNTKVTIFGFGTAGKYPSYHRGNVDSPYVARVEAFCRLHNIPYEKRGAKPMANPRGKLPFANIHGAMVDDSSKIIEVLRKEFQISEKNDLRLSPEQQAQARLIRQMLFGSLYFVQLHHMFETNEGCNVFVESKSKRLPPFPISHLILGRILWGQRNNLRGSGIGRHSHEEIVQMGKDDLACLSTILGTDSYMLGTSEPTDLDADVYAFLAFTFWDDTQKIFDWVQESQRKHPNLVNYMERMKARLYPELGKKTN